MEENVLAQEIIGNKEKATFLAARQNTWWGNTEPGEWKKDLGLLEEDDKCQQLGNWNADLTVWETFFQCTWWAFQIVNWISTLNIPSAKSLSLSFNRHMLLKGVQMDIYIYIYAY